MRDIPLSLKFLKERQKRLSRSLTKEVGMGFLKDAIITQLQPIMSGRHIVDIDFGEVNPEGNMKLKIYYSKGG
jgi:hypothetical protein